MTASTSQGPWSSLRLYAGLDWGRQAHHFVAVDSRGTVCLTLPVKHDGPGWQRLRDELEKLEGEGLASVGVVVETRNGPAVEQLMELGCTVFPLNPKAANRFRDRKMPSGGKDDEREAWAFADALRTDGQDWKALKAEDPLTRQLRILCRDETALIRQRTALVNQLRQALVEYYPAALEAFDDWTVPAPWAFVKRFPTPQALAKAGKRKWQNFLHAHRLYRKDVNERRLKVFAEAASFCGSDPVIAGKSLLAVSLVEQLRALEKQIKRYRQEIRKLFAQHPSRALFDSLPGAADKLAPRLLAECVGLVDRFDDVRGFQCYAGTAPVLYKSGQMRVVKVRWACNRFLRHAVHLWVDGSRKTCGWAQVYYQQKRAEGKSHACAIRCLGNRWLKILWKMLRTGRCYDEAYHTRNQIRHGSWVLKLSS